MRKLFRKALPGFLLLALTLGACERRPLETLTQTTIKVIVKCIWTLERYPERPTGITLYFYRDGDVAPRVVTTSSVDSCEVQLEKGHYRLLMISQSPDEYWTMGFENMNSYEKAEVTLQEKATKWYRSVSGSEAVVENPEMIAVGVADEFDITDEMVEEYQEVYQLWKTKTRALAAKAAAKNGATKSDEDSNNTLSDEEEEILRIEEQIRYYTIRIPVVPENVVSQFWVTIYSGNADVLQSVRAATSGMARSWELTQAVTDREGVTQLIEQWSLTMDDPERRVGHVDGLITTFGLPNGETPSAIRDSTLNVSALLIDNKTQEDYVFNVGDKIRIEQPNPGFRHMYRLVFGSVEDPAITPPDVRPEGGGGFTANVEDWGEEINADVPI